MYGYPMILDCGCELTTENNDCTCCGCPLDVKRDDAKHDAYVSCPWYSLIHMLD